MNAEKAAKIFEYPYIDWEIEIETTNYTVNKIYQLNNYSLDGNYLAEETVKLIFPSLNNQLYASGHIEV